MTFTYVFTENVRHLLEGSAPYAVLLNLDNKEGKNIEKIDQNLYILFCKLCIPRPQLSATKHLTDYHYH